MCIIAGIDQLRVDPHLIGSALHAALNQMRDSQLLRDFAHDRNRHGHVFYRWLNEIPALPILIGVVFLVVMKPF